MNIPAVGTYLLLLAVGCLPPSIYAAQCNTAPIRLSIKNVTIPSGKFRRGVSMGIGTPAQTLAFQPKWDNNNTYVFGPKCQYEDFIHTVNACSTFRGGLFDPAQSTSGGSTNQSFIAPVDPYASNSYSYFTDVVKLEDKVSLDNFPMGQVINSSDWGLQAYEPLNIIGMAPGSLFLDTLYQTGKIASRSFGFFWGLDGTSARDQMDGSFVVGGYDKAKTIGSPYTGTISTRTNCPSGMLVTIRDIVLNFRNGTDQSLFPSENGGTALIACVYPELPVLMDMPLTPQFSNLLANTGMIELSRSTGIQWWNVIVGTDKNTKQLYDGDMTIQFDGGLQIAIPNRLLIVPETKIVDSGDIIANSSSSVILINSLQSVTSKSIPKLGRNFFSLAYLQANQDSGQFSIWQANPSPSEDLVVVDEKNAALNGGRACPAGAANTTSPTTTPSSQPKGQQTSKKSLSTGALAGISVGAVAVIALLAVLAWFLLRKRKAKAAAATEAKSSAARTIDEADKPRTGADYYPSQGIPHYIPQELPQQTYRQGPSELEG